MPPSQNANEIMNYWMNQYYLQCPGFSTGLMYPQRNLTQEYYDYFNAVNMPQDLEDYAAKKGFESPSHATNLNSKDASSSYMGNKYKTSVIHEQTTSVSHEQKPSATHEQKIHVAHKQKTGKTHEQKSGVTHDRKTWVTQEQKSDVTEEQKTGVTQVQQTYVNHEKKSDVTHDWKTGVTQVQKTGVTYDTKTALTYERKTGVTQEQKTGATYDWKTGVTPEPRKTILFASPPKRSISVKVGNSAFVNTSISSNAPNSATNENIVPNENESVLERSGDLYLQQQEPNAVGNEPELVENVKSAVQESEISNGKQMNGTTVSINKKNTGTMTWNDYFTHSNPNFCYVILPTPNPGLYRGLYPGAQMPFLYPMSPAGMFPNNASGSAGGYPGYLK